MDLSRLDLNLLLVFHHLVRLGRVSQVAQTLGMSQPAVSSATAHSTIPAGCLPVGADGPDLQLQPSSTAPVPVGVVVTRSWYGRPPLPTSCGSG